MGLKPSPNDSAFRQVAAGAWRRSSALKAPAASSGSAWQLVEKTSSVGRLGTHGLLGKSIWL